MTQEQPNGTRDETLMDYAVLRSRDNLRVAFRDGVAPNQLDVVVVQAKIWQDKVEKNLIPWTIEQTVRATLTMMAEEGSGPRALARRYGPVVGISAGGGAIGAVMVSLFQMLGLIFGS